MVLSHEYDVLNHFSQGQSIDDLIHGLLEQDRWFGNTCQNRWEGYDYRMGHSWQQRCRQLRVLGDKKAASTTKRLNRNSQLLVDFEKAMGIPVHILHITRHPLDTIATMTAKSEDPPNRLAHKIRFFFDLCETTRAIKETWPRDRFLTLQLEAWIRGTPETISDLFRFLSLDIDPDFAEQCRRLVFSEPKTTRHLVTWPTHQLETVRQRSLDFEFLEGYFKP